MHDDAQEQRQHRSTGCRPPEAAWHATTTVAARISLAAATGLNLRAASWVRFAAGLVFYVCLGACAGPRMRGPARLAMAGGLAIAGGSTVWAVGERSSNPGRLPEAGLITAAVGMVAAIAGGLWIAAEVACQSDPDCDEAEECREIPAPPGGVPYKQCMPR